jgi:hypothetical protein
MAEDADVTALLRTSIESVLGWHVAIRYQLGRGRVRVEDPDGEDPGEPTFCNTPPVAAPRAADQDSIDRMLSEGLGAEVVNESDKPSRKGTA